MGRQGLSWTNRVKKVSSCTPRWLMPTQNVNHCCSSLGELYGWIVFFLKSGLWWISFQSQMSSALTSQGHSSVWLPKTFLLNLSTYSILGSEKVPLRAMRREWAKINLATFKWRSSKLWSKSRDTPQRGYLKAFDRYQQLLSLNQL